MTFTKSEVQNSTNSLIRETKQCLKVTNKKITQTFYPLLMVTSTFVSSHQKANIFNDYFANQCDIYDKGSILPELFSNTNVYISGITITTEYIINIIKKYNTKMVHGYNKISVTMLRLCPTDVAISHLQKAISQLKSNCRPLLPICRKH